MSPNKKSKEKTMSRMSYSPITALLRRIHKAKAKSDATGIPVRELMDQDKELRKQLFREREAQKQRRDFLRAAGGIGLGAGVMAASPMAFANNGGGNDKNLNIAIIGAGAGGMRTAHRLMQYGIGSTIYEASDRVGGRMYSDNGKNKDGYGTFFGDKSPGDKFLNENRVVEYGGEFISTEHTAVRNLAHQLGLELEDANKLSLGDEETYLIDGTLYSEDNLLDVWVDGLYDTMKRAQMDAPWQPTYGEHTPEHVTYDNLDAIDWMTQLGFPSTDWVHKLLLADLVAEYGITEGNSALNLIYLLGWNTRNSGGLPLAGTDERLHVVGGNDLIVTRMAEQLPEGSIELNKKLVAISGPYGGPFTLEFADGTTTPEKNKIDVLVMALPHNLVKEIDIDPRIKTGFGEKKLMGFESTENVSDNGKVMMEFSDRHWDRPEIIDEQLVQQAARAYSFSNPNGRRNWDGFISTWEGDPGHPSTRGVLVNYNGGKEARTLKSRNLHGPAAEQDVKRVLAQAEQIWPGISEKYLGKALVSNWIDDPLAKSAFTSPSVGTMTSWWGAQWESNLASKFLFAGEAYDEEYWSYMNGAILSGERIALEIQQNY
jgi:monoamine oxidase